MSTKARGRGNAHTRRNLAEFDADAHTIEEVMTYNVIAVNPRTSLREATQRLRRQRLGLSQS